MLILEEWRELADTEAAHIDRIEAELAERMRAA